MTMGPIETFMVADHARLESLLVLSKRADGSIDERAYGLFRHELLRHIVMEEKVLLPFVHALTGTPFCAASGLRADYRAIAKVLARPPTADIVRSVREVFVEHNPLEEGARGLYATCDRLAGDDAPLLLERMKAQPSVPLAEYYDGIPHWTL